VVILRRPDHQPFSTAALGDAKSPPRLPIPSVDDETVDLITGMLNDHLARVCRGQD
jgi:hypothetical protein